MSVPAAGSTTESKGAPRSSGVRASAVRAPLLQRECSCAPGSGGCDACKKKPTAADAANAAKLQRFGAPAPRTATAPPVVNSVLNSPGQPLDASARSFMEPRFGQNFGGVRVHTDPQAAESARSVDAHAYTVGQHIVFDSGKYDPHSASGQRLLAHELAHTVQQRNAGPPPSVLALRETPEYNHLENEANSIASAVMSRGNVQAPRFAAPAMLSRAPKNSGAAPPPSPPATGKSKPVVTPEDRPTGDSKSAVQGAESARDWKPVTTPNLKAAKVKAYAVPQLKSGIVAVQMADPMQLPPEKGAVLDIWNQRATAGALEAIIEPGSGSVKTKAGLKQDRPSPDALQKIWLQKVGWLTSNANKYWKTAVGQNEPFPKADGKTCNVDHILELQFGGDNVPNNMQMLDGAENQGSGREIFADLKTTAESVKQALKDDNAVTGPFTDLLVHYDSAVLKRQADICKSCCQAEKKAVTMPKDVDLSKGESVNTKVTGTPHPLKAGGTEATVIVEDEKAKKIPLAESSIPENKNASTLISGFSLQEWEKPTKGGGTVESVLDTSSRFPESLKPDKSKKIKLTRAEDGTLKLPPGHPNLKFHFDYLSEGVFKELHIEDEKYVVGSGTIKPSISFLPPIDVQFDKERFWVGKAIPKDKLKLPIPGVKINKADIGLELAPQFKPSGDVEFSLDAGKRHILDGKISLSADANGLVATGDVQVSLPGVDNAAGHIEYRNRQWSGSAVIETTQLQSKFKYIKSGALSVVFNDQGMGATGKVTLDLPGTKGVDAELHYQSSTRHWLFKGKGVFEPPGLHPVTMAIVYDGESLDGEVDTSFTYKGIDGKIHVVYHNERFSGEGSLAINKGKAKGDMHVKMRQVGGHAKLSGDGNISYQVTDNLVASAGIEINEKEEVRLKGALEFPKPIKLFDPIKGDYKIFEIGVSIPIPGASIGPVGLEARIDGALSAGYQIGPGELRNTKIEAAFNPLDDKPDADVIFTSTLYIGGNAHITGRIDGSVALDAVIAEVAGGLSVTATASLDGHVASQVTLHYTKSKFEADANFELIAGLALDLALSAFVKARAGISIFSVETRKDWKLASYHYSSGLQLGMRLKKPIHYVSGESLQLPSADDIEWIKPDIDPEDVLQKVFGGSDSKEEEA